METKKTYILINNLGGGGAERQVSYLTGVENIDKIFLIEPIIKYDDIDKSKIQSLTNIIAGKSKKKKIIQLYQIIKAFRKLKINKDTHLICFLQLSSIIGFVCKYLFRSSYSVSIRFNPVVHTALANGPTVPTFISKLIYQNAEFIIPNSFVASKNLKQYYGLKEKQLHPITNGYDIPKVLAKGNQGLQNTQHSSLFNDQVTNFINVGRLDNQKGQAYLLDCIKHIKDKHAVRLFFLGEGDYGNELLELSNKLRLKTYSYQNPKQKLTDEYEIYFLGFVQNPYAYIQKADALLFPSLAEGLPNVLVESLILGTPIISANCPTGPQEIMLGHDGANDLIENNEPLHTPFGYLMPRIHALYSIVNSENNKDTINTWSKILEKLLSPQIKGVDHDEAKEIQKRYSLEKLLSSWNEFILTKTKE